MADSTGSYVAQHQKKTIRVPLIGLPTLRSTSASFDQRYVNVYLEKLENHMTGGHYMVATKRPGVSVFSQPPALAATARGFYVWNGKLYSVYGNSIFSGTTNIYNGLMATSTGICGFVETSAIAATKYLAINDGVKLYLISTTDTVTPVVSGVGNAVGFPASNLGSIVFFDGYILVGESNGRIWNSNNEDPTSWGAANFLNAQAFPDNLVALARQNDVVLAFGTMSTQMFYDAANPAPGSFMGSLSQATLQIGCASINSIDQHENFVIWVSTAQNGGYAVQKLDGVTKLERISTEPIERMLNAEGTNISTCRGSTIRVAGHFFYILTLTGANRTFVYDIEEKVWTEWQSGSSGHFQIVYTGQFNNVPLIQHESNGFIYQFDPTVYQDNGLNINVMIQTLPLDFDTMYRKFQSRLELVGDRYTTSNPVSVQYSDDDYQTFSTARTIDLVKSSTNNRAYLTTLGSFRRRAFQFTHTANQPLRLEAMEVDIQVGAN